MQPATNPARKELDQLAKIVADADKLHADAARWPAMLAQAKASQSAAEAAFLASLDTAAAHALAEAARDVHALTPAVEAVARAGGPDAMRRRALSAPEVFAIFSAGFAKRHEELEKLKRPARVLFAAHASAAAVATGADLSALVGLNMTPGMREARALLDDIEAQAQAALVARNVTAAPDKHPRRSFDELLAELSAPLPVVPSV